jgi:hypothetical protein
MPSTASEQPEYLNPARWLGMLWHPLAVLDGAACRLMLHRVTEFVRIVGTGKADLDWQLRGLIQSLPLLLCRRRPGVSFAADFGAAGTI